jgi:hypothetical protein
MKEPAETTMRASMGMKTQRGKDCRKYRLGTCSCMIDTIDEVIIEI